MNSKETTGRWRSSPYALAAALLAVATLAHAQYVWTDDKGLKVFSDRPPPPSVPLNHIVKAPHQAQAGAPAAQAPPAPADQAKGPPSVAEQEAAYRKRKAEDAAKDQKAAADARRRDEIASNCDSMRKDQATLQSGTRIATATADGERTYMSDEDRSARIDKLNKGLADCK
jgi:hypothetical protein